MKFMRYIFLLLFTLSCFGKNVSAIKIDEFNKLHSEKNFSGVVIDVRTPMEQLETGIIPGAQIKNAHENDWDKYMASLDKDKTYYIYCAVGGRSGVVAERMRKKGLKAVNILGGMNAWQEHKLSTQKIDKERFK